MSSAFIFASMSSDIFCHASCEHVRKKHMARGEHLVNFLLAGISLLTKSSFAQVIRPTPPKQDNSRNAKQQVTILSRFN